MHGNIAVEHKTKWISNPSELWNAQAFFPWRSGVWDIFIFPTQVAYIVCQVPLQFNSLYYIVSDFLRILYYYLRILSYQRMERICIDIQLKLRKYPPSMAQWRYRITHTQTTILNKLKYRAKIHCERGKCALRWNHRSKKLNVRSFHHANGNFLTNFAQIVSFFCVESFNKFIEIHWIHSRLMDAALQQAALWSEQANCLWLVSKLARCTSGNAWSLSFERIARCLWEGRLRREVTETWNQPRSLSLVLFLFIYLLV